MQLSLVIPFYNQSRTLPYLLDSIAARAFPGLEVVVVDDCSDDGCADILDLYGQKGLSVRLVRHERRQFTKNARLTGITAAAGKYICFADADDVLWGDCLHRHVALMEEKGADVLHFNAVFVHADYTAEKLCHWTVPHGSELYGKDIFHAFVRRPNGPSVWCRMFSRELCLKVAPVVRESRVLRYGEDLLLTTFLLFHAKKYLGSKEIGYGYRWEPNKPERAPGRLATMYYILTEVIPYLEQHGCDPAVVRAFERHISGLLKTWADRLVPWLLTGKAQFDDERFNSLLDHADCMEFVKIFATCRRLELLAEQERSIAGRITSFWERLSRRTEPGRG